MVAAKAQLPNLMERVQQLQYAVQRMPGAASRELALAVQHDWRRGTDPYGRPQPPTQGRGVHGRAVGILRRAVKTWERAHLGERAGVGTDLSRMLSGGRAHRRHTAPLISEGLVHQGRLTERGLAAARSSMAVADSHRFDPQKHVMESWRPVVRGNEAMLVSEHPAAAALQRAHKGRPARLMHPIDGRGLGDWERRITRMVKRLLYGASLTSEQRESIKMRAAARRLARKPRRTRKDRARINRLVEGAHG